MSKRIERGLRDVGSEHEPPPDWQADVWQRIARKEAMATLYYRIALVMLLAAVVWLAVEYLHLQTDADSLATSNRVLIKMNDELLKAEQDMSVRCSCR